MYIFNSSPYCSKRGRFVHQYRYTLYTGVCNTLFIIIHPLINQAMEIENTWLNKTYGGTDVIQPGQKQFLES